MTHSWQDLAGLTPQFEKTLPAAREDLLALTRDLRATSPNFRCARTGG